MEAKKAKVLKIPARGRWSFVEVATGEDDVVPLETLQGAVGGWIECWWLGDVGFPSLDLFLNEDGKLKRLSFNVVATSLSGILARGDCVVGDAIVCAHDESSSSSVGLTEKDELNLRRRLSELGF